MAGKAPKSGRYLVAADKIVRPVRSPFETAIATFGIKRKLSNKIIDETIGKAGSSQMYCRVVEQAPHGRYIDLDAMASLGVPDTDAGRALYLHAIEQRLVG